MAEFKLTISDPKTGKSLQKEVKDAQATVLENVKIGDTVKGDGFDLSGYEFKVTGGSDSCGFPMRKGIQGVRKKIIANGGVGFTGKHRGHVEAIYKKKTVCGEAVNEKVSQINLAVTVAGKDSLFEEKSEEAPAKGDAPAKEEAPADAKKSKK